MYFTDDSLLPENQAPLMITAAPYGPLWLPGEPPSVPVNENRSRPRWTARTPARRCCTYTSGIPRPAISR